MFLVQCCKLCNHRYASNIKGPNKKAQGADQLPRILSCGHTFCDKCIQTRLITQAEDDSQEPVYQAICPYETCKTVTSLQGSNDTTSLEINMFMIGAIYADTALRNKNANRLLDLLNKKTTDLIVPSPDKQVQERCYNCQNAVAVLNCQKCEASMCEHCFSEVHKSRVLSSHKPTYLELKSNNGATIDLQSGEMCDEHPDRRREYYCLDCSVAMCPDCGVLGSHPAHNIDKLHNINQKIKPALLETRARASRTLDLIHQTKKKLASTLKQDEKDVAMSNPTILRIDEMFTKLHAMLQLKQHEIIENVFKTTGNDTYVLQTMEDELEVSAKKVEHLLTELDRILSYPAYEKSCDFTLINTSAQGAFSLPCHMVENNVDQSSDVIQVQINEDLVRSLSEDLVTVTAQSPTVSKYELVSIDKVSEDVLASCPPLKRSPQNNGAISSRRDPSDLIQHHSVNSVGTINVITDGQYHQTSRSISPSSSHGSYSRQSSNNSYNQSEYSSVSPYQQKGYTRGVRDPYSVRPNNHNRYPNQHDTQPFYEDVDVNQCFPNDQFVMPSLANAAQQLQSPPFSLYDGFSSSAATHVARSCPPQVIRDYNHRHTGSSQGSQDARLDPNTTGGTYENFEMSARKFREDYSRDPQPLQPPQQPLQQQQQQQEFRSRDVRLVDTHYLQQPGFTVCREGAMPLPDSQYNYHQQPNQMTGNRVKGKAIGRGRGAPAPIYAPPPGPSSQYQESHKKKLFMYNPEPITENTSQITVSHIESPGCLYVQHPFRAKGLKKIQQRINEHCAAQPPLNDLHNVSYLFARVNGTWRRGEVRKVMDRSVVIFCVDYGYTATVKCHDLRAAIGSLLALPKIAVRCYLQGIQPSDGGNDWLGDTAEMMQEVLSHCKALLLVKLESALIEDESLPIDLLMRDQTGKSLLSMRDYLVFIEKAVWDSPVSPYVPDRKLLNQTYLKPVPLNEGDYLYIYITHVVNPNELYCQMAHKIRDDMSERGDPNPELVKLEAIMRAMNEKYKAHSSLLVHRVFVPKSGLAVAASYEGDWYRAQIISLQPGHVKVKYIDYGNTEIVAADQIRVLTRDFQELPAQAVCLSIHGISPVSGDTWSDKICDGLTQLCTDKHCKAQVMTGSRSEEGLSMILNIEGTDENIADVLVTHGLAKRSVEDIVEGEGVECSCMYAESPGEFYVRPVHLKIKLESMTAELNVIMNEASDSSSSDGPATKWQINDNCVVKHGNNWVRAIIEEIKPDNDRCKIRLIDFGTLITKPGSSLRPHPQVDGVKIPALSTLTAISGIIPAGGSHTWGNLAKEAIKELIEGQESCRVVPKGQATDVLPCDVLLPEELPSKIQGVPGELQYISVRNRLLDMGVALKGEASLKSSPTKASSNSSKSSTSTVKQSPVTVRRNMSAMNFPPQPSSPPTSSPSIHCTSDQEHNAVDQSDQEIPNQSQPDVIRISQSQPSFRSDQSQHILPGSDQLQVSLHGEDNISYRIDSELSESTQADSSMPALEKVSCDNDMESELFSMGESQHQPQPHHAGMNISASASYNESDIHQQTIKQPTVMSFARVVKGAAPSSYASGDAVKMISSNSIMRNNASMRMVKSPGGTIRSNIVDEQVSDPTEQLLTAAASALSIEDNTSPRHGWHGVTGSPDSDSSSSDIPTPELCAQLNQLVGKPNL